MNEASLRAGFFYFQKRVSMMAKSTFVSACGVLLLMQSVVIAPSAWAASELEQKGLTPIGAERAANAAGTIPAWTGGVSKAPANYKEGDHYPNPFAGEKPLYTVTASNMASYAANLSVGQQALLKKYPTWNMPVYPTHRTAAFPQAVYDATSENPQRVRLVDGGNGFEGTSSGVPFPRPKLGVEVIWNHITAYRGDSFKTSSQQVAVTTSGDYTPVHFETEFDFHYNNLSKSPADREPNKLVNVMQSVTSPSRLAGQAVLVHEYIDQVKNPRMVWTFNPGQRRVRLAPNVAYDNPAVASDGLRTNDDFALFNGATDRYDWQLLGKRELLVPYNDYALASDALKVSDIVMLGHINPAHARYELHRVWVVEGRLKKEFNHVYSRRTFYVDEDSWSILVADTYDARGQLWRVSELHTLQAYNIPALLPAAEVHHDLLSGRYIVSGLINEEPRLYRRANFKASDFSPSALRQSGIR
jgi:hypothetical protein